MSRYAPSSLTAIFCFVASFQLMMQLAKSDPPTSPTFRYALCRNDDFGSYAPNSPFETSLKTVLSDLADNASTVLFHNSSSGSNSSTVHGQFYCRGDVSPSFCGQCVQAASENVLVNCSSAKAAIVWYNECTLKYRPDSMYGIVESNLILNSYSRLNLSTPTNFSTVLKQTVSGLIHEAAQGSGLATAERPVETLFTVTVYFLVQCGADLNSQQCESCLETAFNETKTCCGEWPATIFTFTSSCQVMYSAALFYFKPGGPVAAPPPPPASQMTPPAPVAVTPPSSFTPKGGSAKIKGSESVKLGVISIALVTWVLRILK